MTDFSWFKTYVQAWIALTDPWTDEQGGAHMRLLCVAWTRGFLPIDPDAIRQIRRWSPGAWKRIWPALEPEWPVVDGKRINLALEAHREDSHRRIEAARSGGKASAAARTKQPTAVEPPLNGRSTGVERQSNTLAKRSEAELSNNGSLSLAVGARVPPPIDLSPGQLQAAVSGLVGAWNNICAVEGQPFVAVNVRSHPKATQALRLRPEIDWWAEVFRRVVASDWLRRDARFAPAGFWWVLEHAEEIAVGQHDNRERVAPLTKADELAARRAAATAEVLASFANERKPVA